MPQPTPKYSDKIYDALQEAYGPNGKLSAGAFSASKDDFIKGLKDSGYVNKIYGALNEAYGADGSLSKGAFTADEPSFRDGMGIGNPLPFYLTSAKPSKSPIFIPPPPVADSADDAMSKDVKGTGKLPKETSGNKLEGSTARMVGGAAHAFSRGGLMAPCITGSRRPNNNETPKNG